VRTQAAVLWQYGQDWQIEELDLDDPREGEGAEAEGGTDGHRLVGDHQVCDIYIKT
jgi:hypothetical protein